MLMSMSRSVVINGRSDELYEVEAFQSRLRDGYLAAFELRDADRVVTIDGNKTVTEVHQLIMEQVNALLP